ncbi:MAG: recombination protein RecR [Parcubacteria group bacterium Gr01-1014_107]|nr:MAG: recombination protein RecR [Parcubacteria group bacterium Gr01-1014_107]
MSIIERLALLFTHFPGVGQRQAKRFVYFLLSQDKEFIENLAKEVVDLKKEVVVCPSCFRFFDKKPSSQAKSLCSICHDEARETGSLMVVSHPTDLENVEKSGVFKGKYFVLGGIVPILEKEPGKKIRLQDLRNKIKNLSEKKLIKEIILAMNFTPEGENTGEFLKKELAPLSQKYSFKISTLGKGLSSGLELEYSDSETLKNALINRS